MGECIDSVPSGIADICLIYSFPLQTNTMLTLTTHPLTDKLSEEVEKEKQIVCMSGILQNQD